MGSCHWNDPVARCEREKWTVCWPDRSAPDCSRLRFLDAVLSSDTTWRVLTVPGNAQTENIVQAIRDTPYWGVRAKETLDGKSLAVERHHKGTGPAPTLSPQEAAWIAFTAQQKGAGIVQVESAEEEMAIGGESNVARLTTYTSFEPGLSDPDSLGRLTIGDSQRFRARDYEYSTPVVIELQPPDGFHETPSTFVLRLPSVKLRNQQAVFVIPENWPINTDDTDSPWLKLLQGMAERVLKNTNSQGVYFVLPGEESREISFLR